MTNFILKKQGQGNYKVEVIIEHEFRGDFNTTDSTLVDDIKDWLNGGNDFYNYESRASLELDVRDLAGINSIAGVDFSSDITNLLNL